MAESLTDYVATDPISAMGYAFHITRETPIAFTEFVDAANATDGLRVTTGDIVGVNPRTGEKIMIKSEGGAELYDSEDDVWIRAFHYSRGKVSFEPPDDWEESDMRRWSFVLATKLKARVVGDEGELYT